MKRTYFAVAVIFILLFAFVGCESPDTVSEIASVSSYEDTSLTASADTVPQSSSETEPTASETLSNDTVPVTSQSKPSTVSGNTSKTTSSKKSEKKKPVAVDDVEGVAAIRSAAESSIPDDLKTIQNEIFEKCNAERIKAGLSPLKLDYYYFPYAKLRAEEATVLWSHTRPSGGDFWTVYADIEDKVDFGARGENLAMLFRNADQAVEALMKSAPHRENIMKSEFTRVSVAVLPLKDNPGFYIMSQMFFEK